jgi:hypothetical protein
VELDSVRATLASIEAGELVASIAARNRWEAALSTLEVVLGERSSLLGEDDQPDLS